MVTTELGMRAMATGSDGEARSGREIEPGDRVRMSPYGLARHPKYGDREGLVVARGAFPSSLRVKFDERKSIQALHRDYLELIDGAAAGPSAPDRQGAPRPEQGASTPARRPERSGFGA